MDIQSTQGCGTIHSVAMHGNNSYVCVWPPIRCCAVRVEVETGCHKTHEVTWRPVSTVGPVPADVQTCPGQIHIYADTDTHS